MKKLVRVESQAKAKKIQGFLEKGFPSLSRPAAIPTLFLNERPFKIIFFSNNLLLLELNIGKKLKYFQDNFNSFNENFFEGSGGNLFRMKRIIDKKNSKIDLNIFF